MNQFPLLGLAAILSAWAVCCQASESALRLPPEDDAGSRMLGEWKQEAINPFPKPDNPEQIDQYTWGKLGQALALFLLDGDPAEANRLVRDACSAFYAPDGSFRDHVNFHWKGNLLFRIHALFSARGSYRPGLLDAGADQAITGLFWVYANKESSVDEADGGDAWTIWGSENHHLMRASTLWSAAAVLSHDPQYAGRKLAAGRLPAQHLAAWSRYFVTYLREHFGKGLWMEYGSPVYLKYSLQALYNFHDFAADDSLRDAATACLDLHWTAWAVEQVGGMRGGAKVRAYSGKTADDARADSSNAIGWYYYGVGPVRNERHPGFLCALSSAYRPPAGIAPLVLDPASRAAGETFLSRLPGQARRDASGQPIGVQADRYAFDPSLPGLLRTTFRNPEFALGSFYFESLPMGFWTNVASQNHWLGLIAAQGPDAIITVRTEGEGKERSTYNAQRAVQKGGTLMVQGMPRPKLGKYIWPLSVSTPTSMRKEVLGDWIFIRLREVFVAFRPTDGGFDERAPGVYAVRKRTAPVIFQAAPAKRFPGGFDAFKELVLSQAVESDAARVSFRSALDDCVLGMDMSFEEAPTIDGKPIDIAVAAAWASPVLNQPWGGDTATVSLPGQPAWQISPTQPRTGKPATATW